MSTNDVPGANPSNADKLAMGCWAESPDGSLIFVKSTEGGRVIFEMYEMQADPIVKYTTAMKEDGFKKAFSWTSGGKDNGKWTWHDKTPFPWDKVIEDGVKEGTEYASIGGQLSDTRKVIESLIRKGVIDTPTETPITAEQLAHMKKLIGSKPSARAIADKLQAAIASANVGETNDLIKQLRNIEE